MPRPRVLLAVLLSGLVLPAAEWPGFGGPSGDFTIPAAPIASNWSATGPRQIWKRLLGDGYSGIAVDKGVLYTMYSFKQEEFAVALDAGTGKTRWEVSWDKSGSRLDLSNGPGPHTTPLILGDRVYVIGIRAKMHALDKATGKIIWTKDLYKDFPGSTEFDRGYSPSPIVYKNTILVKLGGPNHAIVALSPKDGSLLWAKQSFSNSPATPALVKVGTRDILLAPFASELAALDPANGNLLWSLPHKTDYGLNITTPLFTKGDNIVTITSAYSGGARGIQFAADGTHPRELWHHNRLRVHFTSALEIDGYIYGSSGDFGPSPLTCVEAKTGKVVWQDRTFSKGNLVRTGDKTLLLTEDGTLALINLTPQGMKVLARIEQITLDKSWTAPSLVGTTLYIRDRRHIQAVDLR